MYLGNQPALAYTSFAKQDFTTSATTSYTLDNPVANENEIALFINFVRQEPTTAYTASGTSLTLTSATSASDDMYCVYLGKAVQTVNPPSGSVGLDQLSATGTKDSTTFLRGDNTFATAGGDNTPAFRATMSTNQTNLTDGSSNKVTFDTEDFDSDSAYDNSTNYRFTVPSGQGGKYFITAHLHFRDNNQDADLSGVQTRIMKNGSFFAEDQRKMTSNSLDGNFSNYASISTIMNLSVGDYVEIYARANGQNFDVLSESSFFSGFKLIGV